MGILDPKKFSTQDHLDIEDIRDDLVVLKNGKVSVVIETSSLNFELLDPREQDARISTFASFLNSITFPIQIVMRTQKTDIARYLKLLESYKQKLTSESVINQVTIYQEFIRNLTQSTSVLDKRFYTVIPSVRMPVLTTNWVKQLLGKEKRIINVNQLIVKAKEELYPKRDHIIKQFANLGIAAKQLQNDELIKLYYTVYEPDQIGMEDRNIKEADIERGIISRS